MTFEGASGPKVLDSMCVSISSCPLVRTSRRKGPGGSLMPHSTAAHSPQSLFSRGTDHNGLHGQCFPGTSCDSGCVPSPEAQSGG